MPTWDPYAEIAALRRDFERAMAARKEGDGRQGPAFLPGRAARGYPLVNLGEDRDNWYVEALAPGIDPSRLELTVVRNTLTVAGEKPSPQGVEAEAFHRNERSAGRFVRTIDLPAEVDSVKVDARYTDGLLTVTLPKAEAAKPKQVKVKVS